MPAGQRSSEPAAAAAELRGQVGLVTGAGRGIGAAIASGLAAAGMHVVAVARTREQVEQTAAAITEAGGSASGAAVDIRDGAGVARLVAQVHAEHGPVDLLVNNAGSNANVGPMWEAEPAGWWQDVEINLQGTFLCARAVLPEMVARGRGRVINILGGGAQGALPYFSAYAASKAAVARLTETMGLETESHGVQVFGLGPGTVRTKLAVEAVERPEAREWTGDLREMLEPMWREDASDAARTVVLLASGAADALNGRLLHVDDDIADLAARSDEIAAGNLYRLQRPTLAARAARESP